MLCRNMEDSPKLRSESRGSGEVRKLSSNALEEQPCQAVAVDCGNARRRQPPDQPEPDHIQIFPQPISLKRAYQNQSPTNKNKLINHHHHNSCIKFTYRRSLVCSSYHVILPPLPFATLRGFLTITGAGFRKPVNTYMFFYYVTQ